MPKQYAVNEIYYTLHGEGVRYGIPHVFVRLAACNLTCGFCDTEFESYVAMTADEIVARARELVAVSQPVEVEVEGARKHGKPLSNDPCRNVLFCGGEPLLQLDDELIGAFKHDTDPWYIAVETNGTRAVPGGVDWITCSPKVAEHALKLDFAHELKYVRAAGQGIPRPKVRADFYLISPIFDGNAQDQQNVAWCVQLVKENPRWRLTMQHHKTAFGGIR